MNIALCQINTIVGDFRYNADKVLSFYKSAVESDADLVVFPEMTITGYPPQDLLLENRFVIRNLEALEKISYKVKDTPMIVGYVR
ncbi:MAG: nitrilase-related carbon-nitrogen hydrolase, partial [Nitrosopumilus sp.]